MKKELKAKLILQKFMENMPMVVEVVFQIKTPLLTILNTGNAVNYNIKHISTLTLVICRPPVTLITRNANDILFLLPFFFSKLVV
jgi:hypothetical protein